MGIMKKLYAYLKTQINDLMMSTYDRVLKITKGYNYREEKSNLVLELL